MKMINTKETLTTAFQYITIKVMEVLSHIFNFAHVNVGQNGIRRTHMFEFLIGGAVGLFVGWNFLPQPQWVKDLFGFGGSE